MVHLNRIYTRSGDAGQTSLGDGRRVPKTDARIVAYGTVDELNCVLGLCLDAVTDTAERARLDVIQNDLFDLGADLCVPPTADEESGSRLRMSTQAVTRLENWIDEVNDALAPLTSFVLPGGNPLASAYHMARTVCRRAEREVLVLAACPEEPVGEPAIAYLNRLSDLLFVLARAAAGDDERLWRPGAGDAT
jgi:cob(I)alamin adenosyltransferase